MSINGVYPSLFNSPVVVLVCGGRDFAGRGILHLTLDTFAQKYGIKRLVHGDARGADRLAKWWAEASKIPHTPYPAQWARYGRAAGAIRNQQMLDSEPEIKFVIAFPGGSGTADMVERAVENGVQVVNVTETGELCWVPPIRDGEGL